MVKILRSCLQFVLPVVKFLFLAVIHTLVQLFLLTHVGVFVPSLEFVMDQLYKLFKRSMRWVGRKLGWVPKADASIDGSSPPTSAPEFVEGKLVKVYAALHAFWIKVVNKLPWVKGRTPTEPSPLAQSHQQPSLPSKKFMQRTATRRRDQVLMPAC